MNLNQLLTFFAPKNANFQVLFSKSSANLVEAAKTLRELFHTDVASVRHDLINRIEALEHKGDNITHEIFKELSSNFITPFDREDIHYLASSLDDVLDYIHTSAQRLELMKITTITAPMKELADILVTSALEIDKAMGMLKNVHSDGFKQILVNIQSLENQADAVFDHAIAELYANETDAIVLMKYQQVIDHLETATDKCEDVANVIETIMIKNS
ncbi:MAG: DUF47 domain-containing protein [Saprospiraceae bacterium]|nr:DUF47 domain-containing protein [Saprospiraceae bacterium]